VSRDTIPGRNIALGTTLALVSLAVIAPLAAVVLSLNGITPEHLARAIASPDAIAAFRLTFVASLVAALIDLVLGSFVAWILVRYQFPGRPVLDALVDVPLAIPTAVTGITLATIYGGHGFLGAWLEPHGIHVAYTQIGVALALVFVGFPFVVRTVQPVLAEIPKDLEEAASSFGAGQTLTLRRVIFPLVFPAMLTGFALSLARALGEYGSVVFIAGNLPGKTEIAPLLIITRLEEYDYQGASAVATVLLIASFGMLLAINALQRRFSLARKMAT
jgi:sulfate transport system permease protein